MANYAYIENFQIIELHDTLPLVWKNISNFHAFTDDEIKPMGWHRLVKTTPEYDPATQKLGAEYHYVLDDVAYESYEVQSIPQQINVSQPTVEELNEEQWVLIRQIRDNLLAQFDWRYIRYQRELRLNLTPTDDLSKMDIYTQALADITTQADPFNITWPDYTE